MDLVVKVSSSSKVEKHQSSVTRFFELFEIDSSEINVDSRDFSISTKEIGCIIRIEVMLVNLLLFAVGENQFNSIYVGFVVVNNRY